MPRDLKGPVTLGHAFQAYAADNAELKSMPLYEQLFERHIDAPLRRLRVDRLDKKAVATMVAPLRDRPVTYNQTLSVLRATFEFARNCGWCEGNPAALVKSIKIEARSRVMSPIELQTLAARLPEVSAHDPLFALYVHTLLLTGARRGELEAATDAWLGPDNCLTVPATHTKGQKTRTIFLPDAAANSLRSNPGMRLFSKIPNLERKWDALRNAIGCPGLHLHDLRHALATVCLGDEMPIEIIGRLLGHSDVRNTRIYAEFTRRQAKVAADRARFVMAQHMEGKRET